MPQYGKDNQTRGKQMGTIAGIFNSRKEAERAFSALQTEAGFSNEEIVLLAPGSSAKELDAVPTDEIGPDR